MTEAPLGLGPWITVKQTSPLTTLDYVYEQKINLDYN